MSFSGAEEAREQRIADQKMAEQVAFTNYCDEPITVCAVELGSKGTLDDKLKHALITSEIGPWNGIVAVVKRSDHVCLETAFDDETEYQVIPLASRWVSLNRAIDTFTPDAAGMEEFSRATGENVTFVVVSSSTGLAPSRWKGPDETVLARFTEEASPFLLRDIAISVVCTSRPTAVVQEVNTDIRDLDILAIRRLLSPIDSDFAYVVFVSVEEVGDGMVNVEHYLLAGREVGVERVYNPLIHRAQAAANRGSHFVLAVGQDQP